MDSANSRVIWYTTTKWKYSYRYKPQLPGSTPFLPTRNKKKYMRNMGKLVNNLDLPLHLHLLSVLFMQTISNIPLHCTVHLIICSKKMINWKTYKLPATNIYANAEINYTISSVKHAKFAGYNRTQHKSTIERQIKASEKNNFKLNHNGEVIPKCKRLKMIYWAKEKDHQKLLN